MLYTEVKQILELFKIQVFPQIRAYEKAVLCSTACRLPY